MSNYISYTVTLNYPSRKSDDEKGWVIAYRQDTIRTTTSIEEAKRLARDHRLRPEDYIYIIERRGTVSRSVYSRDINKEHSMY